MRTVSKFAIAGAIIGLVPLSSPLLVLLEIAMVYRLSRIHGKHLSISELGVVRTLIVSAAVMLHAVLRAIFDFPLGWLLKPVIAVIDFLFIFALGSLANWYFEENPKGAQP